MKRMAVFFGGFGYTTEKPLFYYLIKEYRKLGYEIMKIEYRIPIKDLSLDEWILLLVDDIRKEWKNFDFSEYEEIIFISKSIGTRIAGMLGSQYCKIKHIFLTPLKETLPFIRRDTQTELVLYGTSDPYISSDTLKMHCEQENIPYIAFQNANHSLETCDLNETLDIIKEMIKACTSGK